MFVTLFNLQGTRCVPQRFLMISLRFPFVKNFFQKLFSFFQALSFARSWSSITAALAGDLVRIPYSVRLVKNFFEFFKLFSSSFGCLTWQEKTVSLNWPFVLALPIFPARLQASIFGRSELNFRVRNGNGWTLALINTNLILCALSHLLKFQTSAAFEIWNEKTAVGASFRVYTEASDP